MIDNDRARDLIVVQLAPDEAPGVRETLDLARVFADGRNPAPRAAANDDFSAPASTPPSLAAVLP